MNNSNQATRQNSIVFTGNVSQVKPLQNGGAAISLAYNEGSMVNGQWETKDTLFLETYLPAKLNFIPNVGDKMTISGFMASNNYQPEGGKKKFGVRIVVNEITEYSPKQAPQQYAPQNAPQQYAPQNAPQQHAPQQGGYQNRPAPQQHAPQQGGYQNRPAQQQGGFQSGGGFAR